ncbi:hypothetical protein ABZ605_28170 [Streptomyces sp. NPDC012765]|uniref:hypothetical protein n=1 Tax=Streptomyces sp. NPDC012765 TaxID=3155249 RepID=UPI0033FBBE6E
MAARNSQPQPRRRKPAARKAAALSSPDPAVLDEARATASSILAEAEQLAGAKLAEATQEAEKTVASLLDEAQQQADMLRADAEAAANAVRAEAEVSARQLQDAARKDAKQVLEEARASAEQVLAGAVGEAAGVRGQAEADAGRRMEQAVGEAERLRGEASDTADQLRAEAKTAAEALLEQARADAAAALDKARAEADRLRGDAEQVLARGQEEATRIRTEATAEADRLRAAGTADRERAQGEADTVRTEAAQLRDHALRTAEALRTQAEETATRIRGAATTESARVLEDATSEADRTRRAAEEEANRQRAAAQSAVANAERSSADLLARAKDEATGIVARATAQAEGLAGQVAADFKAAEAARLQAKTEADSLLEEAREQRDLAAAALAKALDPTVQKLQKRTLKDEAKERRRAGKRKEEAEAAALREGRSTWVDKTRDMFGLVAVRLLTMIPILAPMAVAWTGQSGFAIRVLAWGFAASLVYAAAYELSTAFCAYLYDQARQDGDKGWGYRIATWLFGAGAAVQQWWHYSNDWNPTARAVTFSAMSMVGVILWEMLASLRHRRKRRKAGNLPPALPSLGMDRWVRYPVRSWTARSLMIDAPSRFPTAEVAWTVAGRVCADRKARRTGQRAGRPHADRYMVTVHRTEPVRRTGPAHGPSSIPAVHVFVDRPERGPDRTQQDRADRGPDRTSMDRPDRVEGGPDRPKALDRGPDHNGPARPALPSGGSDRTATKTARTAGPDLTKKAPTSADRGPVRTGPTETAQTNAAPAAQRGRTGQRSDGRTAPGPTDRTAGALELNTEEQRAIDILLAQNKPISRRSIGEVVRAAGGSIATDRASEIARHYPSNLRSA